MGKRQGWLWALRRLGISSFLIVHMTATLVWVLPNSPLRAACIGPVRYYVMPLGLWQYWGMFAPDPLFNTFTLEAEVVDVHGLRYQFDFPKIADYTPLGRYPRFRHPKYAANLGIPDMTLDRLIAARHVVRSLGLPAESFPLDVDLNYQVRPCPPPGGPPADPLAPTYKRNLSRTHFMSLEEVKP